MVNVVKQRMFEIWLLRGSWSVRFQYYALGIFEFLIVCTSRRRQLVPLPLFLGSACTIGLWPSRCIQHPWGDLVVPMGWGGDGAGSWILISFAALHLGSWRGIVYMTLKLSRSSKNSSYFSWITLYVKHVRSKWYSFSTRFSMHTLHIFILDWWCYGATSIRNSCERVWISVSALWEPTFMGVVRCNLDIFWQFYLVIELALRVNDCIVTFQLWHF